MATRKRWLQRSRRTGFTLLESLVSVTITAIAGTALFSAIGASLGTSYSAMNQNIATGLADQMLDELAAVRFPVDTDTRPGFQSSREYFDDLDDYDNWSSTPPENKQGYSLGREPLTILERYPISRPAMLSPDSDFLNRLTREVTVERIQPASDGSWETTKTHTSYRRVIVTIKLVMNANSPGQIITEATRIFSYVPLSP